MGCGTSKSLSDAERRHAHKFPFKPPTEPKKQALLLEKRKCNGLVLDERNSSSIPAAVPVAITTEEHSSVQQLQSTTKYEVFMIAGNRRFGAATKAPVTLTIFGEYESSDEIQLLHSRTNKSKPQRNQLEVFLVETTWLGPLKAVQIRCDGIRKGSGWFLDRMYIRKENDTGYVSVFHCNSWLSLRRDDKEVVRTFDLSDVITPSQFTEVLQNIRKRDLSDLGESESSDEDDKFHSPERNVVHLNPVREESERDFIPVISIKQNAVTSSTVSSVAASIIHIAGTLPVPNFGNLSDSGFNAIRAESLFDVSSSEEEDQKKENEKERGGEGEEEFGRYARNNDDEEFTQQNSFNQDAKQYEEGTYRKNDNSYILNENMQNADNSSLSDGGSQSPEFITSTKYQDLSNNKESKARESVVSVSGVTPLILTLQRFEEKKSTMSEERVAYGVFKKENEVSDVACGRENTIKAKDRRSSSHSDIKTYFSQERRKHRESVTYSELVIKKGKSIHEAAIEGNLERMKELIEINPFMKNAKNERGMTPLHLASSNGHVDCVKWLTVSGVDLAEETPTGYTAMHLAAMNGHVNCMMVLSALGATVTCRTIDELSPLHLATMSGHLDCVRWLLINRALTDVIDINQRTPLDLAEEYGHKDVVRLLIKFEKDLLTQDCMLEELVNESRRTQSIDSNASQIENTLSKFPDSGVGGLGTDEESDTCDRNVTEFLQTEGNPEKTTGRRLSTSAFQFGAERQGLVPRNRTDSIVTVEEKKEIFLKQKAWMQREGTSFLDSIRMQLENEERSYDT